MAARRVNMITDTAPDAGQTVPMILLCRVNDIPEGEGLQVALDNMEPIALFRLGEEVVAVDDTCTHGCASLSEGMVDGEDIICPFHAGAFNLRTGEPTASPCTEPLRTHRIAVRDGAVYLLA